MQEIQVRFLGLEYPLERRVATHCSILAWEIPQTGDLAGSQSVGHDRGTNIHWLKSLLRALMGKN